MYGKRIRHSAEYLGKARDYWWNDDYLGLLASRLTLGRCHNMLDVGCGKGYMAFKIAPFLGNNAKIHGIDSEPKWIQEAQEKAIISPVYYRDFSFQVGNAYNLPFDDNSMELTVCQTLLIHMNEPEKVITEMIRVTKQGHNIIAFEPNNRTSSLVLRNLNESNSSYESMMRTVDAAIRMENGKKSLGEGFNSIGDLVPEYFEKAGLENIKVWLCDKVTSLIPPYDDEEKQAIRDEMIEWMENNE
jgi:ubiquinone/menaquinone biosynthesis C-methylase UbiE